VSDLVALDAKLLLVARRFTGIRCSNAPIKFAVSPGMSGDRSAHRWLWHADRLRRVLQGCTGG
jgi:hypothetical protein